jgi:hypothetical protein
MQFNKPERTTTVFAAARCGSYSGCSDRRVLSEEMCWRYAWNIGLGGADWTIVLIAYPITDMQLLWSIAVITLGNDLSSFQFKTARLKVKTACFPVG